MIGNRRGMHVVVACCGDGLISLIGLIGNAVQVHDFTE